jgi:CubicO group peptidase (beta-lactamase class C family)
MDVKPVSRLFLATLALCLAGGCTSVIPSATPTPTSAPALVTAPSTPAAVPVPPATSTFTPEPSPVPSSTPTVVPAPTATPSPTVTETPRDPAAEIDTYLGALTEENSFTGAVLVARSGQVLLSQGYGLANRDENLPNTPQIRFRIGSITKQFTAMGILILEAQGSLDVRDQLCAYLAECPAAWQEITLRHLLLHSSGIPDFTGLADYEATKHLPATPLELIARFRDLPLEFDPGSEWRYSNSGYILLGYVIEQVSGQPYDAFIQQSIFEPLQMADSGYDHNLESLARGYTGYGDRWSQGDQIDMSVPYAAGALYSTVEDLYRWDQALYTERLVPQALLDEMFRPAVDTPLGGYGYGWIISERQGHRVVRHGGGGDGFVAVLERYPDDAVTVIVLSNRDTTDVGTIASEIAVLLFARP